LVRDAEQAAERISGAFTTAFGQDTAQAASQASAALTNVTQATEQAAAAANAASKTQQATARTTRQTADANEELNSRIKALSNAVRTSRNLWAARVQDDEMFQESTAALHAEMAELMGTTELTGNQMRKLTQDMAYAQRGLDSAAGAASKGGLAWTAQIAIANQFGQTLRGLGPAGAAAAGAMGIISRGASSMGKQMAATQITIQGVTTALRT